MQAISPLTPSSSVRRDWDKWAIGLSALCGAHCLLSTLAVGLAVTFGGVLHSPHVHEVGLGLAIMLGVIALGFGAMRHGAMLPVAIGSLGLGVMGGAMSLPHGPQESFATMLGLAILTLGHLLNRDRESGRIGHGCSTRSDTSARHI